MEWRKLLVPLFVILIVSVLGVWLVTYFYRPTREQLGIELAKALLQIAAVLILGQLVSIWIEDARYKRQRADQQRDQGRIDAEAQQERERQHITAINDFRKETLDKLIETYSEAKKIRRLLRATCSISSDNENSNDIKVYRDVYDKQMQAINDVQIELESIKQEVKTSIETASNVFSNPKLLKGHVSSMESYLRKIVTEYEENLRKFKGVPPSLALSDLSQLSEFIYPRDDDGDFYIKFVDEYHSALNSIRSDILSGGVVGGPPPPNNSFNRSAG